MAIRTVVTRGYGNGTFNGTIGLVVLRGYVQGAFLVDGTPLCLEASDSFIAGGDVGDAYHARPDDTQSYIAGGDAGDAYHARPDDTQSYIAGVEGEETC